MSPVLVPPRPARLPPREPPAPDPLDAADEALARVRASLKDATDDEVTGRHEITVNVNTGPAHEHAPRLPQPSAHELSEYVAPVFGWRRLLAVGVTVISGLGAVAHALGWI